MRGTQPERYVLGFDEVDRTQVALAGGKGANLGELSGLEGVHVPAGCCVTTDAFRRVIEHVPPIDGSLDRLSRLGGDDPDVIGTLSAEIREIIEHLAIPDEVAAAITDAVARLGDDGACAVRSSATAEDLPTASFAGQHDTFLNVVGPEEVLRHVRRCWASLFTERAVIYRVQNGIDHRTVRMAVVVQRMVDPIAAGVLFTADPVTSNRRIVSVEATRGLGEALVAGRVSPDVYEVRDGRVTATTRAGESAALTDSQLIELAALGRRIEAHFGSPQDIEWCLLDDRVAIVQSRPITTLFPIPAAADDTNHVYVSVGHQQMMTDPMKPLGLSLWQMIALRPMFEAGGRLFVDVTGALAAPATRAGLLEMVGRSDPLIGDALQSVVDRGNFVPTLAADAPAERLPAFSAPPQIETDPTIVADLIARTEASIDDMQRNIRAASGEALLDFIVADVQELKRLLVDPQSQQVIMAAMEASWWLDDHLDAWLGEQSAVDALTLSAPGNVTSEMGLALLDVADVIRPHVEVVTFLRGGVGDGFLEDLPTTPGGQAAHDAIAAYLDVYGMRCIGEIDITRPRWSERPSTLVPVILTNVDSFEPGERERRFERGRQHASAKRQEVLQRLRALPDGEHKAVETERMIDRVRTFIGYREYPKYGIVRRTFAYKQALLEEADRLVHAGALGEREDMYFLTMHELRDVVRTHRVDGELIRRRKAELRWFESLTPPRVLTSDGEVVTGSYRRDDLPAGALVGLPVSAGTIEGRARVVLDIAGAALDAGDILVTTYTDPSWSPLFVQAAGLVTEVGGLMTHGAVIAREYGLPAVVGVEHATRLILDGQRIRVHGAHGYVEIIG